MEDWAAIWERCKETGEPLPDDFPVAEMDIPHLQFVISDYLVHAGLTVRDLRTAPDKELILRPFFLPPHLAYMRKCAEGDIPKEDPNLPVRLEPGVYATVALVQATSPHVYVVSAPSVSVVKIGIAYNPKKRLSGLQSSSPVRLKLEGSWDAKTRSREVERACHELLWQHHSHGEWFRCDPERASRVVSTAVAIATSNGRRRFLTDDDWRGLHAEEDAIAAAIRAKSGQNEKETPINSDFEP